MAQMPDLTKMINDALNGAREQIAEAVQEMAQPMLDAQVANEAIARLVHQNRPEGLHTAYAQALDRIHAFEAVAGDRRNLALESIGALIVYVRLLDA